MTAESPPTTGHPPEPAEARVDVTATALARRQASLAADWARSQGDDRGEIVAVGQETFNEWLFSTSSTWRTLWSVRLPGPQEAPDLVVQSLRNNRRIVDAGLEMASVFANERFPDDVLDLLAGQPIPYRVAAAPLSMKVVDRQGVLLEGPSVDGRRTLMMARDPSTLALARRYWQAVLHISLSAADAALVRASAAPELSTRQRAVAALLAHDASDEHAAQVLDVSVRTLRTEVAAIKRALGVSTRFAAGLELGRRMSALPPA